MLEARIKNILSYLHNKERELYTGGIRMGFEDGRPISFAETTHPDKEIPEVDPSFNIEGKIRMACTGKFYGTLFMVYTKGYISHFYSNRTWQGRVLEEMLQGNPILLNPPKRVAIAVRR
jgi:hypothetical protein